MEIFQVKIINFSGASMYLEIQLDYPVLMKDVLEEVCKCLNVFLEDLINTNAVLINGRSYNYLSGIETEIKSGDNIVILPFMIGG